MYNIEDDDYADDLYDVVPEVSEEADAFDAYDSAGYLCMRGTPPIRQRLVTDPTNMGTREKFQFKDRVSKSVRKPSGEEVDTVLKVTEPLKKVYIYIYIHVLNNCHCDICIPHII